MRRLRVFLWVLGVGIGLMAATVFLGYSALNRCGHVRNTKVIIHTVEQAMVHYRVDHADPCPPSLQALVDGHYITKLPRDEWGQPLRFTCPGLHASGDADADVVSAGKDRRYGTADDINSWDL
jgi:hypothetical protein